MRRAVLALAAAMLCAGAPAPTPPDTPRPLVQATVPDISIAPAAARLDQAELPANPRAETLLRVTAPGRFAITAHSVSGAALELVDMITGPTMPAGNPGTKDGRLDQLLDTGTYKLRVTSAAGATGQVGLRVAPFHDAAPAASVPAQGEVDASLSDLEQRSFWFTAASAPVRIEAAGRALSEMRLWRDGRELVAVTPLVDTIEPTPSHTLRRALFEGVLPPGTYLATIYGGPPLPWADGGRDMPFHLRAGGSDALRSGWVAGHIGPFCSEIFEGSAEDTRFRLEMRGPASLSVDGSSADIDRKAREPATMLDVAVLRTPHRVVVTGPEGTAFQMHASLSPQTTMFGDPGTWWITAVASGLGGDEVPATPVLAHRDGSVRPTTQVVASAAPEIAPGHAWHARFNLAGPSSLNVQLTGGPFAARLTGTRLWRCDLHALGDQDIIPEVHDAAHQPIPGRWDVPAGWYTLELVPRAPGIAELTLGTPGETAPLSPPGPASPAISLGVQALESRESLILFDNAAPGAATGLDARPTPVGIAAQPLRVSQQAGQVLQVPVARDRDRLVAVELGRGEIAASEANGLVTLAAPDHPRVVALMRVRPAPPPVQPPAPVAARTVLRNGAPAHFDLAEGEQRSFALDLAQGGLMRVETQGRLHTRGTLATDFIPELRSAEANGVGENMRVATWLRAGRTRVDVTALASAGHLGLVASPAPVLTTQALLPGATLRQSVPAGTGLLVPIEVRDGDYRLELLGLGRIFTARLEDAEGWPLQVAAPFDTVTQTLGRGRYRLLVLPESTDARAVLRLTRVEKPTVLTGHGPHPLPFTAPGEDGATLTWREPAGRDDPRAPDLWSFALAAASHVTIGIGDGMEAVLRAPDGHTTRFSGAAAFKGRLVPGAYVVEARSQGRNDRLDYTISLSSDELQPDVARPVSLPGRVTFAVAQDRVASLTSFGRVPVRATVRDQTGAVVGRYGAREGDWNVAISRLLPAGRYTVDLDSAAPPELSPVPNNVNDGQQAAAPEADAGDAQPMDGEPSAETPDQPAQSAANDATGTGSAEDRQGAQSTEVTLTLPADAPSALVPGDARGFALTLAGGGVHRLPLATLAPGSLLLAGAAAGSAVAIALEQYEGGWHTRAVSQGNAPLIAWPTDGAAGPWRLSVWAIDGGALPIRVAARQVGSPAVSGAPHFAAMPLTGVAAGLAVAHVALPSRAPLELRGRSDDVLVGAWPGHEASAAPVGPFAPQADDLWLVGRVATRLTLAPLAAGAPFATALAPAAVAALPSLGSGFAWVATAQGQPGIEGGPMGVAANSAFALAAPGLTLRDAGDGDALRVAVRPVALHLLAPLAADGPVQRVLEPGEALPIDLPAGARALHVTLAPGLAAIAGWRGPAATVVWTGEAAVSRTLDLAAPNLLLVNTGAAAAPASVAWGGEPVGRLRPDAAQKRFFGASGSFDMQVDASAGQHLVAGQATATFIGSGRVLRGHNLVLPGPGRVTIDHGPGLVAVWLQGPGANPWPAPAPVAVTLPGHVALSGPAMRLALPAGGPVLASLHSTAPVILGLGTETPALYPAGVAIARYLPAGTRSLLVVSPQDGPLAGTLDLDVQPVRAAGDGLGAPVALAPGEAALFGFTLADKRRIGLGVQAQPDRARVSLLDEAGHTRARGNAALLDLPPGRYLLQVQAPADASLLVRPAIVGIGPNPNGPPADVVASYRALAGLKVKAP